MNQTKQLIYFVFFTISLLIVLNIIHELGHIVLQLLYNVPIKITIENLRLHSTSWGIEELIKLPRHQFITLYLAGFIFSILPLFFNKIRKLILSFPSEIIKKYPNIVYSMYIFICLLYAKVDFIVVFKIVWKTSWIFFH